jgi:hypothetical protein
MEARGQRKNIVGNFLFLLVTFSSVSYFFFLLVNFYFCW